MNFGEAVEMLNEGRMMCRAGWNGTGLFIFRQVPGPIPYQFIENMKSLPSSVKEEFARRANDPGLNVSDIYYSNQIAIVDQSNLISGWSPSVSDALSEDWQEYMPIKQATFHDRLKAEAEELEHKLDLLDDFLSSDKFDAIDLVQKALLKAQAPAMASYLQILKERLERL